MLLFPRTHTHCESIPYVWIPYMGSIPYALPYNQFRPNNNLEAINMRR
jgi:hypothetical protein